MQEVTTINSIDTLCTFIMRYKPDLDRLNELLWHVGIKAIILDETTHQEYCRLITEYWNKWNHTRERPIFIGVNLDVAG